MVHKPCPNCRHQIPVACKTCPCGHVFTRRPSNPIPTEQTGIKRRRTERVKRERPDYYSASEIEKHIRRINASARAQNASSNGKEGNGEGGVIKRRKAGRPKGSLNRPKDNKDDKEEDMFANISNEKALLYSVVLAEINRKIQTQWRGPPRSQSQS
ncbi:UPF0547 protein C16orf87 homolog [Ptychodera flava]|uniref:UPF0547 protein C16orf87 homolog n=1 Tax=Ptychodera flava TaxID=63121 RepID=UPI00396A7CBB